MNETCDRCGPAVSAVYTAYRADRRGELYLCGHCTNVLWPALFAKGWSTLLIRGQSATAKLPGR